MYSEIIYCFVFVCFQVEVADNLTDLTEDIVSRGYTGLVKLDKRDSIIR